MMNSATAAGEFTEDYVRGIEQRNAHLERTVEQLQRDLNILRSLLHAKLRPGVSRFDDSAAGQLVLFEGAPEPDAPPPSGDTSADSRPKKKRSRSTGRQQLPPGLPRVKEVEPVEEADLPCSCCDPSQTRQLIRYEETEILEYRPAELFVRVIQREVRACPSGMEGVTTAAMPPRIIEKGRPGVSLLVYILISKYVDHLPLHRIAKIFKREQVRIPETTICDWVAAVADAMAPIVVAMKQWLLDQPYLQADETPAKARDPGKKGKLKQIYFFALSTPWKEVVFEYSTDRRADSLSSFLGGFTGDVIQVDEYVGYDRFFKDHGALTRAGCWAHAVRKFKAAIQVADRVSASEDICRIVSRLENLESLMREKERTPDERLGVRRRIHAPGLSVIRERVDDAVADPTIEPKSAFGQAVRYLLNHWSALSAFLEDGRIEMDNNGIEHSIRPLAIGRKNWLHIGHIEAGDRAAVFYSIFATCARMGIDPREYLYDVLEKLPIQPFDRIHDLTPRNWLASRQQDAAAQA